MQILPWRTRLVVAAGVLIAVTAFVAALFLSGGRPAGSAEPLASAAQTPSETAPSQPPPALTVRASDYGRILFDGRGRALYAFTRDEGARSTCAGACAQAWPPYLVRGSLRAGPGVTRVVARHGPARRRGEAGDVRGAAALLLDRRQGARRCRLPERLRVSAAYGS
jgi:predicted lipoprotein with Yx(FWY)xxD motif